MAWEQIKKRGINNGGYGTQWQNVPCVAVTKSGVTFNKEFIAAYAYKRGSYVHVFIDRENRRIGLKLATNGEDIQAAFKVQDSKSKSNQSKTMFCTCKHVGMAFKDCTGRAFRAHLNPGERIVEVSLAPENLA